MPFRGVSLMDQRTAFVSAARIAGANVRELCRTYAISPTTGYKWLDRAGVGVAGGLADRSRRPHRSPRRTAAELEAAVVAVRLEHPRWGGRKIHHFLKLERIVAPLERDEADVVGGFFRPAPRNLFELALGATNYPDVTEILGRPVFRKLTEVGRPIDMVNVFRRPSDIPPHVDDILAAKPKFVWFQLGIRNDEAAQKLAEAGIKVVQDRCLMVEQGRMSR